MATIVILSTASKRAEAKKIADALLKEKLAACVNLLPKIESHYWWKGKIQSGQEVLMLIKTERRRFKAVEKRIKELHSYDVPEVLALPVVDGSAAYLAWITRNTK